MNKHVVNVLSNYSFSFDKEYGYGEIDGYEVNVFCGAFQIGPTFLFSSYLPIGKKSLFVYRINENYHKRLVKANYFDYGVSVVIGSMTGRSFEKNFSEVLRVILDTLKEIEAPKKDICPFSGRPLDPLNVETMIIQNTAIRITVSKGTREEINNNIIKDNEAFANKPNNYLKGFLGILLGSLIGLALSVGFSFAGLISFWAPFASVMLGVFFYKKFGGKPNGIMFLMSVLTTLVMLAASILIIYTYLIDKAMVEGGYPYRGFEAFTFCMQNIPEIRSMFYRDLILNIMMTAVASFISFLSIKKSITRPKTF